MYCTDRVLPNPPNCKSPFHFHPLYMTLNHKNHISAVSLQITRKLIHLPVLLYKLFLVNIPRGASWRILFVFKYHKTANIPGATDRVNSELRSLSFKEWFLTQLSAEMTHFCSQPVVQFYHFQSSWKLKKSRVIKTTTKFHVNIVHFGWHISTMTPKTKPSLAAQWRPFNLTMGQWRSLQGILGLSIYV